MSVNWYGAIKLSQTIDNGCLDKDLDTEVHKGPKSIKSKYKKGMRVRDRRRGMVNPQNFGVVDSVMGNIVKIIWNPDDKNKRREEKFDVVEDTEKLSLIVAEV